MKIVIFGTGKVADVVYRHIVHAGTHEVVAFAVDAKYRSGDATFHGKPVVAFETVERQYPSGSHGMIVAIGYHDLNALRRRKYEEAKSKGYELASYVSPRAGTGDWLQMGQNCIILDNATIEPGVVLGNNVVVWSNVLLGHHTAVEDHCWIAGQAVFGGTVRLGEGSFVGLGAIVGHEVELGPQSFLSAGALVTKCADAKSVFIQQSTEPFRLDSERFLKISKLR